MPEAGAVATLRLSNATAAPSFIWLEPWVDELWLSPRSELTLHTVTLGELQWPEIEANDDEGLTIWASAAARCGSRSTMYPRTPSPPAMPRLTWER